MRLVEVEIDELKVLSQALGLVANELFDTHVEIVMGMNQEELLEFESRLNDEIRAAE